MLNEIMCLSMIMFGEARGEPQVGQVAVAYTAVNRKADPHYPNNICKIMTQESQYEFVTKYGIPKEHEVKYLMPIAEAILNGRIDDPTRGAKWFHTRKVKPVWSKDKPVKLALGNHIFY